MLLWWWRGAVRSRALPGRKSIITPTGPAKMMDAGASRAARIPNSRIYDPLSCRTMATAGEGAAQAAPFLRLHPPPPRFNVPPFGRAWGVLTVLARAAANRIRPLTTTPLAASLRVIVGICRDLVGYPLVDCGKSGVWRMLEVVAESPAKWPKNTSGRTLLIGPRPMPQRRINNLKAQKRPEPDKMPVFSSSPKPPIHHSKTKRVAGDFCGGGCGPKMKAKKAPSDLSAAGVSDPG